MFFRPSAAIAAMAPLRIASEAGQNVTSQVHSYASEYSSIFNRNRLEVWLVFAIQNGLVLTPSNVKEAQ